MTEITKPSMRGFSFCVTGVFDYGTRPEVEQRIKSLGGTVHSTVRADTSYLLIGGKPGASKMRLANTYGTRRVYQQEFARLTSGKEYTYFTSAGQSVLAPGLVVTERLPDFDSNFVEARRRDQEAAARKAKRIAAEKEAERKARQKLDRGQLVGYDNDGYPVYEVVSEGRTIVVREKPKPPPEPTAEELAAAEFERLLQKARTGRRGRGPR